MGCIRFRTLVWALVDLLATTVLGVGIMIIGQAWRTHLAQSLVLTGATTGWRAATIKVGYGRQYHLLLGIRPTAGTNTMKLGGTLQVLGRSRLLAEIPFEVALGSQPRVLIGRGWVAYYSTVPTNTPGGCLDSFLRRGNCTP